MLHRFGSRARMLAMDPWWIAAPTVAAGLAGLTAYGAVRPSSQLFGSSLYATDAPRKFALTFDDGPNPSITPKLLDLLDRHNVKATFFVVGNFVRQCPALVKETYARGHVIGNHTDTHPNLFFCGPAAYQRRTAALQRGDLKRYLGVSEIFPPTLWISQPLAGGNRASFRHAPGYLDASPRRLAWQTCGMAYPPNAAHCYQCAAPAQAAISGAYN